MNARVEVGIALAGLQGGESVIVSLRKGWRLKITYRGEDGFDATLENPHIVAGEESGLKFYAVDTTGHPYGAPMVVQEPTLGIPLRDCGVDVDGTVVGAIVRDAEGTVTSRFSWSNLVFVKQQTFSISPDGKLVVDGVSQGYLYGLFLPDKNRMRGYVGVFGPTKPEDVRFVEMEDLVFNTLDAG